MRQIIQTIKNYKGIISDHGYSSKMTYNQTKKSHTKGNLNHRNYIKECVRNTNYFKYKTLYVKTENIYIYCKGICDNMYESNYIKYRI